jgi:hypothetical protein
MTDNDVCDIGCGGGDDDDGDGDNGDSDNGGGENGE